MGKRSDTTRTAGSLRAIKTGGKKARRLTRVHPEPLLAWPVDGRIVIGRDAGKNGLSFSEDGEMSRTHAEIAPSTELDLYRLRDLDSKNGTRLDGQKVDSEHLHPGAVIGLGSSLFVYSEISLEGPSSSLEQELTRDFRADVSLARQYVERLADLAAPTPHAILIRGPTGAGKELLAQRIHRQSGRTGQLVSLNCGTLNRELLGSELFGHAAGAFSGATSARTGLIATADGGTLFLDEIAELPLDQQPALLRVLQERMVRPIGSDRETSVDVRVIAASHRSLDRLSTEGSFRLDLYARLSAVELELPGLDSRREEIVPLFRELLGSEVPFSHEAVEALLLHDWTTNVREIQQLVNALKVFAPGIELIDLEHLPGSFHTELESLEPRCGIL